MNLCTSLIFKFFNVVFVIIFALVLSACGGAAKGQLQEVCHLAVPPLVAGQSDLNQRVSIWHDHCFDAEKSSFVSRIGRKCRISDISHS